MSTTQDSVLTMSHEDRLQRLEGNYTEVYARQRQSEERIDRNADDIRQNKHDIRKLQELNAEMREDFSEVTATMRAVSDQFRFMSEKIQDVSDRMIERAEGIGTTVEAMAKDQKEVGDKVKKLERQDAKAEKIFDWKMKFLYGTGAAVGGSILTLLVSKIATILGGG